MGNRGEGDLAREATAVFGDPPIVLAGHDEHRVYGSTPVDSEHLFAERAEMLRSYTVLAAEGRALASELGL